MTTYWLINREELIQYRRELPQCCSCSRVFSKKTKSSFKLSVLNSARLKNIRMLRKVQQSSMCGLAWKTWASSSQETFQTWAKRAEDALLELQEMLILENEMMKKNLKEAEVIKRRMELLSASNHPIISRKSAICLEIPNSNQIQTNTCNSWETTSTMTILRSIEDLSKLKLSTRHTEVDTCLWRSSKFLILRKMEVKVQVMALIVLVVSKPERLETKMRISEQVLMKL